MTHIPGAARGPRFDEVNLDAAGRFIPDVACDHCGNTGYVWIDGTWFVHVDEETGEATGPEYDLGAAPCPMCRLGQRRNDQHVVVKKDGKVEATTIPVADRFWSHTRLHDVTWQGGLTAEHSKCYECHSWTTLPIGRHKATECKKRKAVAA